VCVCGIEAISPQIVAAGQLIFNLRSCGCAWAGYRIPDHMPGPPLKLMTFPASEAQHVRFLPRSFAIGSLLSGIDRAGDCSAFAVYSGQVGVFMPDGQGLCRNTDGSATARSAVTHVAGSARYDRAFEPRNSRTFWCRERSTDDRPRLRPLNGLSR
jgi:hypothetical protein